MKPIPLYYTRYKGTLRRVVRARIKRAMCLDGVRRYYADLGLECGHLGATKTRNRSTAVRIPTRTKCWTGKCRVVLESRRLL